MNAEFRNRQLPYSNPLANVLVIVVGVVAIAVSFVIGIFALLALLAAVAILGAVIAIRLWWMNYKARKSGSTTAKPASGAVGISVIEGEFKVVPRPDGNDKGPQT